MKSFTCQFRDFCCNFFSETFTGVQSRTNGGSTDRQFKQSRKRSANPRDSIIKLLNIASKFLAQAQWNGVLKEKSN